MLAKCRFIRIHHRDCRRFRRHIVTLYVYIPTTFFILIFTPISLLHSISFQLNDDKNVYCISITTRPPPTPPSLQRPSRRYNGPFHYACNPSRGTIMRSITCIHLYTAAYVLFCSIGRRARVSTTDTRHTLLSCSTSNALFNSFSKTDNCTRLSTES